MAAPAAAPTIIQVVVLMPLPSLLPKFFTAPLMPSASAAGSPGWAVPSLAFPPPPLLLPLLLLPLPLLSSPSTATAAGGGPPGQGLMKAATRTRQGRPSAFQQASRTCTAAGPPAPAQKSTTGVVAQPAAPADAAPAAKVPLEASHSSKEYSLGPLLPSASCGSRHAQKCRLDCTHAAACVRAQCKLQCHHTSIPHLCSASQVDGPDMLEGKDSCRVPRRHFRRCLHPAWHQVRAVALVKCACRPEVRIVIGRFSFRVCRGRQWAGGGAKHEATQRQRRRCTWR